MKVSITLVLATLLFVILGCSLDKFKGEKDSPPPPPSPQSGDTATTGASPAGTKATDSSSSSAGSSSLTLEKFNKIELGMSYEAVKGIIGSDGTETSSSKIGDNERKSIEWKGDKFARMTASFRNDKLTSKSQSSLGEKNGTDELSVEKFNKADIGMSYDEVKGIFGSAGELTTISQYGKSTSTSYTWKGPNYERVYGRFKDGKLQSKSQSSLK